MRLHGCVAGEKGCRPGSGRKQRTNSAFELSGAGCINIYLRLQAGALPVGNAVRKLVKSKDSHYNHIKEQIISEEIV